MESIYFIFIIILFLLAISDLIVGVSNDAVNFLNSAVGSRAATFRIIMLIAATGVLMGTVFSGGMMEIARSGVFYPEKFSFAHIIIIFLAVMITDVILLDTFNTIGFPTSTTVSLVFELLGAAVAIAVIQLVQGAAAGMLGDYINSGKAFAIISGILVSVIIAFTSGTIIQFITRLIFSFDYEKKLKYLGGLFGGVAITTIVYFILIKGAKDAAFMTESTYSWIKTNSFQILLYCFTGVTALLYLLNMLFRVNILKIIVLVGTFALAMAFAGNDLVNFIGVPLAGYESYLTFINTPGADPDTFGMGALNGAVKTPLLFLLLSGIIMVITLYTSRKARTVIMTEVNLSRQDEGEERFGSTALSRGIVRASLRVNDLISAILPESTKTWMNKRFTPLPRKKKEKNQPAFDLLRASVNLVASSALIALGTSLKLPLSTTYVTFMVAMGTSLSDGAWDRESAVFRITGVFSVIGGWFFTAISAFTIAFLLATAFYFGGTIAIVVMIGIAVYMAYRTHRFHLRKEETVKAIHHAEETVDAGNLQTFCLNNTAVLFSKTKEYYNQIVTGLGSGDEHLLKALRRQTGALQKEVRSQRKIVSQVLRGTGDQEAETAYQVIRIQDNLLEIINCLNLISGAAYNHLVNHHKPLNAEQISDLHLLGHQFALILTGIEKGVAENPEVYPDLIGQDKVEMQNVIEAISRNEVNRIREEMTGNRSSILFMNLLQETRNLVYFSFQVLQSIGGNNLKEK